MTTEWRYIKAFATHFARCGLHEGETVAILSESQSRPVLVETARLAAQSLGGRVFDVVVPTPPSAHAVPIRCTGASQALAHHPAVIAGLAASDLVIDCTVEGTLHSPELGQILGGGARVPSASRHGAHFGPIALEHRRPRGQTSATLSMAPPMSRTSLPLLRVVTAVASCSSNRILHAPIEEAPPQPMFHSNNTGASTALSGLGGTSRDAGPSTR